MYKKKFPDGDSGHACLQPTTFHLIPSHILGGRGVSVEGQAVAGAAGKAGHLAGEGSALDVRAKSGGGLGAKEAKEIGTKASNVGRGHRSARDGVLRSVSIHSVFSQIGANKRGLTVAEVLPIHELRMLVPGAKMSTREP